jgi:hypothetical protein
LHEQQLGPFELPVLLGSNDGADDFTDLHSALNPFRLHFSIQPSAFSMSH